ncbi:alpha/beta fold hydrolase [Nocardia sp. CDC153]|uniref:thioesterase II family protein n=1 Tax=Nocardia sp. CDC153 TaxID=3112167 RepID=UPI002DBC38FB|nr:alpha/beta fold hydrolase [Nocardia sp. CDC153]MEC3956659.1 alpha/beta fold hydrolase [Nocardia sp. CDC153]
MTVTDLTGTTWLRELKSDPNPSTVLVCFPPGGGSVTAYRTLAQRFGSGTAVFGIQYPGRQDRLGDALVPELTELADRIAADLLAWPKDVPLAIFGHSMGAMVAYETARRVEAGGRVVSHLFVSGRPAPDFEEPGRLHEGPDEGLIAQLELLSNDPESVRILRDEPSLAELVLPALRNDYRAVETYRHRPGEPLRTPITALVSKSDPTTTAEQAERWRAYTAADFELATFDGGHFYLDLPENQPALVDLIARTLSAVAGRSS